MASGGRDFFFPVRSTYTVLEELMLLDDNESSLGRNVFRKIWESPASSKVIAFSWQLLLDRIPTRVNLAMRRILPTDAPGVLCFV